MHMARFLNDSLFSLKAGPEDLTRADILPGWGTLDRLGVVIREPYGAIGASLLIQLSVLAFYEAKAGRRTEFPEYPEIYLFHVGGQFGDHRPFDFWPPRKEVFLPASPMALLEAINDRSITFLALPEGSPGSLDYLSEATVPWAEQNSFLARTRRAFLYSPGGMVADPHISIRALDAALEANGYRAMNPDISLDWYSGLSEEEKATAMPGPSTLHETKAWAKSFLERYTEIPRNVREAATARRQAILADGKPTETYRIIGGTEALERLSGPE
jgi:hypothetical protein